MPTILGANTESAAYEISNSLRLNDDDGSYFYKTIGNANTGEDNATLSFWFKLGNIKTANNGGTIMTNGGAGGNHIIQLYAQKIYIGSATFSVMFPNLIRDPSAWYHLFIAFDSSQGTSTNRVKAYLNGVLLTDATGFTTYPDQNENLELVGNGNLIRIGSRGNTGDEAFDGYLAEFHYLDGTTKAYTDFGEFNDNGVWIPIEYTGGSYGNNGFYFKWEDSGALGTDSSSNADNFTPSGFDAQNSTTDTPTNNFCTMSPIDTNTTASLSEGNTQLQRGSGYAGCNGTFGVANGKWYWEIKTPNPTVSSENSSFGVIKVPHSTQGQAYLGVNTNSWAIMIDNAASDIFKMHNNSFTNTSIDASANDIFQIALDMDNNKVYFGRNGTYFDSGNPSGNSNETYSSVSGDPFIFPTFSMNGNDTLQANFGNAPFSISSGNSDANGYGNFEYAVPSGYYSLCTKNLAEYG